MELFSRVFSGINSVSITFAMISDQKNMPFWNHTDSTPFSKVARKVGQSASERSNYAQVVVGARNLVLKIGQLMERQETWKDLPQHFLEYIQSEVSQIRAGGDQALLSSLVGYGCL